MRVLIAGASVAGPTAAYWLARAGHEVTVVERTAGPRRGGGHAVDLFRPALEIIERMGVLAQVQAKSTGTERGTFYPRGLRHTAQVDIERFVHAVSDRHVEIMRDDLSEILVGAAGGGVEYVLGDSVAGVDPETGEASFERGPRRTFDVVIGADGLHSTVRRLVFGSEDQFMTFLGAYFAVFSLPRLYQSDGRTVSYLDVGRLAATYGARHLDDARALFLFRPDQPLSYQRHDTARQKDLLRAAFTGLDPTVDAWLEELDGTPAFYLDAITQLAMPTCSRGRVTLIGDAGYCPGPVVGGSTSLAVVGAYVLAGELAGAGGEYREAFAAAERQMAAYVDGSRSLARSVARTLIPANRGHLWALAHGAQLLSRLPRRLARAAAQAGNPGLRLADSTRVRDYPALLAPPA